MSSPELASLLLLTSPETTTTTAKLHSLIFQNLHLRFENLELASTTDAKLKALRREVECLKKMKVWRERALGAEVVMRGLREVVVADGEDVGEEEEEGGNTEETEELGVGEVHEEKGGV